MSDPAARARTILGELIGGDLADRLDPAADLVRAGVNSGELVRLALLIEERYDTELASDDMGTLRSIEGIASLLERLERRDAAEAGPVG